MINKVCVLDLDLDLEVITSRLSSNWTRHRLYVELYCQYSCRKLFSVFLIKTLIFLCIFLCFLKILLCFWLCFLSILGLQSPWKHCKRAKWPDEWIWAQMQYLFSLKKIPVSELCYHATMWSSVFMFRV